MVSEVRGCSAGVRERKWDSEGQVCARTSYSEHSDIRNLWYAAYFFFFLAPQISLLPPPDILVGFVKL